MILIASRKFLFYTNKNILSQWLSYFLNFTFKYVALSLSKIFMHLYFSFFNGKNSVHESGDNVSENE